MLRWWVVVLVAVCILLVLCDGKQRKKTKTKTKTKSKIEARELPTDDEADTNDLREDSESLNTARRRARLSLQQYYSQLLDDSIYGLCIVQPITAVGSEDAQQITGTVDFRQSLQGGETEIRVNLTGFDPEDSVTLHGFHVHEYGDLSDGCDSTGGHYNPFGVVHGAPEDSPEFRHFGDLGNVIEKPDGNVEEDKSDYLVSLLGPFSILGRAVVVHADIDDLGRGEDDASLSNGNAGRRLACCTVGLSDGHHWLDTI